MPIVNYELRAKHTVDELFRREDLSEPNKTCLRRFLTAYTVTPARRAIFAKHIPLFLLHTADIQHDMLNRDLIDSIFGKLRSELSPAYYSTVVNVSKAFVRWLNDGETPDGFKHIKNVSKKEQRRDLTPEDMLTWEDGLKIVGFTSSVQLKAVVLTQLDGGFRPSEFIDLNYGDITVKKDFLVVRIKDGKTGSRNVVLFKSVPYLLRWWQNHQTKKNDDPLWIMEFAQKSNSTKSVPNPNALRRYEYAALVKRVRELGERADIKKPLDFYNFRHSACYLAKMENLPLDHCAKNFGHSVTHFTETYGRLSVDDALARVSKHYGLEEEEKKEVEKNKRCSICEYVNTPISELCERCLRPLTLKKALEAEMQQKKLIEDMQMGILQKVMLEVRQEFGFQNLREEYQAPFPGMKKVIYSAGMPGAGSGAVQLPEQKEQGMRWFTAEELERQKSN